MAVCEVVFKKLPAEKGADVRKFCEDLQNTISPLLGGCNLCFEGPLFHPVEKPWTFSIRFNSECSARTLSVLGRATRNLPQWGELVSHMSLRQ